MGFCINSDFGILLTFLKEKNSESGSNICCEECSLFEYFSSWNKIKIQKDKSFIINLPIVNDLSSLQKIELKSGIETSYRSLNK